MEDCPIGFVADPFRFRLYDRGNLGIRMTEKQGVAFRQGLDLGGSVNITLEEAFTGKGIPVKLHRQVNSVINRSTFNSIRRTHI